jgi:RNA polymerase sigma-70 factor (ECF subfamily)
LDSFVVLSPPESAPRSVAMTALPGTAADPEADALAALDRDDLDGALTVLMRAYGAPVYRYCRQLVEDRELAEDAHQLTFVQAYQGLARFSRRSSLRSWLFGIARHRCLDALKIERRRRRRFGPLADAGDRPRDEPTVEERLAGRSLTGALARCLRQLAPRIRATVLLRFQQGLSYADIERLTGERATTLQARVVRALPLLRRCLEQQGLAP